MHINNITQIALHDVGEGQRRKYRFLLHSLVSGPRQASVLGADVFNSSLCPSEESGPVGQGKRIGFNLPEFLR